MPTRQSVLDTVLLANPSYLMVGELSLFIATAIVGWLFSWSKMPLFPALNVSGLVLLVAATILHILCGQAHKQAHVEAKNITHNGWCLLQNTSSPIFDSCFHESCGRANFWNRLDFSPYRSCGSAFSLHCHQRGEVFAQEVSQ